MVKKKGFYFTMDAFFASILIVLAIIISSKLIIEDDVSSPINHMSKDLINSLSNIKISEVNNSYIKYLISNKTILHPNNTIIEQIGEFYVLNQSELAYNLSDLLISKLVPDKFGVEILVNDEVLLTNSTNTVKKDDLISYRRLVSGFEKFKPIKGATSKVYLQGINAKTYSIYSYFGGFVGQGNVTTSIFDSPPGDNITEIYMELDAGDNFDLYVNEIKCNTTFYPSAIKFNADNWNITSCKTSIIEDAQNNFSIIFLGDIENAFVGGGFIRIKYVTDELQNINTDGLDYVYLPNINGLVNLYSSFYVPGTLNSMEVFLHYDADFNNETNNTLYLTIGNETILKRTNLSGEESLTLTDINLTQYLNYTNLSLNTIPIRLGYENVTFGFIYEGNADVMLVTDVSGSMDDQMGSSSTGTARNCDDSNYDLSTTARLSVAKCLDKDFSKDILNITGNQIGLVSYSTTTDDSDTIYPTTDIDSINTIIGNASPETGYSGGGYTCICCGINSARDILIENLTRTVLIPSGSDWNYTDNFLFSQPANDSEEDTWFSLNYDDENTWDSGGTAILGATNRYIYTPTVVTELDSDLGNGQIYYLDLWEHISDTSGAPNDFSSGTLNYTANTFGISAGDDGWDWDSEDNTGIFGYDDDMDYNEVVLDNGDYWIEIDNIQGGSNTCSDYDCSGAYGIEIIVTSTHYNAIQNGGTAIISFNYEWDDSSGNPFGSSDEVWIKSYWQSPTTGIHYLGSEQSSVGGDTTLEVDYGSQPDNDFSGTHTQDITSWIENAGSYYLVLGGKIYAGDSGEHGEFRFDDIQIEVTDPDDTVLYGNLWEHISDVGGAPADFGSGTLNYTANTFGISGSNDGWDWDTEDGTGQFGYDDDIDYNEIVSGQIEFDNDESGGENNCNNHDCSGAYGIEIEITNEMYNIMSNSGSAFLSFDYEWDDDANIFENADQIWIKARWTSPTSGTTYLGSNLDSGHDGEDSDNEIATSENPNNDISGTYLEDISGYIEGAGNYYLELGGKLIASQDEEFGDWRFDNIELKFTNKTNHYFFRHHFTINDLTLAKRGVLNLLSDDYATIYLNGNEIISTNIEEAEYWNIRGFNIDENYFRTGDNVIAVELINSDDSAKFDLELSILNATKEHAMMVMSDGEANRQCGEQGTGSSTNDAIQAACDAKEDYGITVYAVGYSDQADDSTLQSIAECGEGLFTSSDNTTALQEFYSDVAASIVSTARHSQTIEVQGNLSKSILYGDSYILLNYTPENQIEKFGKISVINEVTGFDNCSFDVTIPNDVEIVDAKLTSYSAEHWTDALLVNNNQVYNLSKFNEDYTPLGDPFIINIPVNQINNGLNSFYLRTGDSADNFTGCSLNNTFIYEVLLTASIAYSDVLEDAIGCNWLIEFNNGGNITLAVPPEYSGINTCEYTNASISYNVEDTYDDAMYNLLDNLDLDNDGRIYVDLHQNDFVIGTISVGKIPYPWGPAIAEVRVWK
ncbi:VWA domain-containing protein [archaeon]|jgi:hypothetical protein|nr:VWA domain-containing protein [archaeon]MBT6821164.1 VWA domain-containing protein [archaeon]MBT7391668.1 VWA domain-containing protein [archaeon]